MALVQQSLFADEDIAPRPKLRKANPEISRSKLQWMVKTMREATKWPWGEEQSRVLRETVWPQALAALPPKEAARFRAQIEAECARLNGIRIAA